MTPNANRFELIEIGRGVAAVLVVCFHATGLIALPKYFGQAPLSGLFSFGYAGVDFFFVLSGFIIYYSTYKNHNKPKEAWHYVKFRLIRIYPIYWLVALTLLPMTYLMGHKVGAVNAVMDFLLLPRAGYPFIPVAWTLRHEMLFYFSFLLFFLNVRLAWVYFFLWGSTIAFNWLFATDALSPFLSLYFNDHNLEFLFGILIAQYAKTKNVPKISPAFLFFSGATVFLGAGLNESLVQPLSDPEHSHYHILYGFGSLLMVGGLIAVRANLESLWVNVGTFLGRASYSIYLIHFAVLSATIKALLPLQLPLWLNMGLLVLAGVAIGSLLYQYVERPLLAAMRSRLAKDAF